MTKVEPSTVEVNETELGLSRMKPASDRVGAAHKPGNRILLRPTEVAESLGLGRSTVFALLATGELPCVRFGRAVRIPVQELEDWIKRHTESN